MSMHFNRLASTESYCTKVLSKSSTHVFAMDRRRRRGRAQWQMSLSGLATSTHRYFRSLSSVQSLQSLQKLTDPQVWHALKMPKTSQDIPRLPLVPWSPTTNSCKFLDLQFPFCDILQYVTTILWTEWFYLPFDDLLGLGIAGSLSTSL